MVWTWEGQVLGDTQFPVEWDPPYPTLVRDVDGINLTIEPIELWDHFGTFTQVQLASHDPKVRDLDYYSNWVVLGTGPAVLKIPPQYKVPLLEEFSETHTMQPSNYPTTMIEGNQQVTMHQLVRNLRQVQCPSVRVQAYGMKFNLRLAGDLPKDYYPEPEHPLSCHNFWDIGCNFPQPHIILAKPHNIRKDSCTTYPMLMRLGEGYGSLQLKCQYRGDNFRVKMYPLLVHAMKATSGKFNNFDPRTIHTCRLKETNLLNRQLKLANFDPVKLGGLRVEVTSTATSLEEGMYKALDSHLLELDQWVNPTQPHMKALQVQLKFIKKEDYLSNFNSLLGKAQELGVFRGRDNRKPGMVRRYILQDLFNALGWNQGTRTNRWEGEAGPWWNWEATGADIDSALEVQVQPDAYFRDPLLEQSHLEEILRCAKIFKRGTKYRAVVHGEDGKNITIGSTTSKLELGKFLFDKYKYQWTKNCYLVEDPFPSSSQARNLDQELAKYNFRDTEAVGPMGIFHELQGSKKYMVTQGYIRGDGNCQFRVVAKVVYGHQKYHTRVRQEVVNYLQDHKDMVEAMLAADGPQVSPFSRPRTVDTYLEGMRNLGHWGDDATLSAAVSIYALSLVIINPDRTHFELNKGSGELQWHALYYTGNHYELVLKVPHST